MSLATPIGRRAEGLDNAVVQRLVAEIGVPIRDHYLARETARDRVFEVLNALAAVTATVIAGTGNDPAAAGFFTAALADNLADLAPAEAS